MKVVMKAPGALTPYYRNPRQIPPEAVAAVRASIERFGFQQPVVADTAGVIIVGHVRHRAAIELGLPKIPVAVFEGTEAEARSYRLTDNRAGEFSGWDLDTLALEITDLAPVDLVAWSPEEIELLKLVDTPEDDAGEQAATDRALDDRDPRVHVHKQETLRLRAGEIELRFMAPRKDALEIRGRVLEIIEEYRRKAAAK